MTQTIQNRLNKMTTTMKIIILHCFFSSLIIHLVESQPLSTCISGCQVLNEAPLFNTSGTSASPSPGGRYNFASLLDVEGNRLLVFGGIILNTNMDSMNLNNAMGDLWEFHLGTRRWTYLSGSTVLKFRGTTLPTARYFHSMALDRRQRRVFVVAGGGKGSGGNVVTLGDFWRYDLLSDQWTQPSGVFSQDHGGNFGTINVPKSTNMISARTKYAMAFDTSTGSGSGADAFYIFGCSRYDGQVYTTNDLWRYNTTEGLWTWIAGNGLAAEQGVYGTLGQEHPDTATPSRPGSRCDSAVIFFQGSLYLFGGSTKFDVDAQSNEFNDVWRFHLGRRRWTWLNGSQVVGQRGVSGPSNVPLASNQPGARKKMGFTVNPNTGTLYLFGGYGLDHQGALGYLNDFFMFSLSLNCWTYLMGPKSINQLATPAMPGSRAMHRLHYDPVAQNLVLFGGYGYNGSTLGILGDVWLLPASEGPPLAIQPERIHVAGGDEIIIQLLMDLLFPENAYANPGVTIGGSPCINARWLDPSTKRNLTCVSPPGIGTQNRVVATFSSSSVSFGLISYYPPVVESITPTGGPTAGGNTITVSGLEFGGPNLAGPRQLQIGTFTCVPILWSNTRVNCTVPAGIGPSLQDLSILVGDQQSVNKSLYRYMDPIISHILPKSDFNINGGELLSVVGTNFGFSLAECSAKNVQCFGPEIQVNGKSCSNTRVHNHSVATCLTPGGVGGPLTVTLTLNALTATLPSAFAYKPPVVQSINPQNHAKGGEEFLIKCQNFGSDGSVVRVWLVDVNTGDGILCQESRIDSPDYLACKTPATLWGAFYVRVEVAGQLSSEERIYTAGAAVILPKTRHISVQTLQNAQTIIQLQLLSNSSDTVIFEIKSLPLNGQLYQYSRTTGNNRGPLIMESISLVPGSDALVYVPNTNFNGEDRFQYRAKDFNLFSNTSTVTVQVQFVDQPPELFQKETVKVLETTEELIKVDFFALDIDETREMSLHFENEVERGLWFTDAEGTQPFTIKNGSFLKFPIPSSPVDPENAHKKGISMYVKADGRGGVLDYIRVSYYFRDSVGSRTPESGTLLVKVKCPFTQFINIWSDGVLCKACPLGAKCSEVGEFPPLNIEGFFPNPDFTFVPCTPTHACPEGIPFQYQDSNSTFRCKAGYTGNRCGLCAPGFYRSSTECIVCPTYQISPALIICLVILGVLVLFFFVNLLRRVDIGFLGILISYWQIVAVFQTFPLRWPASVTRLYHFFSFLYFNIELVSPECFVSDEFSVAYEMKWFGTLALPAVMLIVTILLIVLNYIFSNLFCLAIKKLDPHLVHLKPKLNQIIRRFSRKESTGFKNVVVQNTLQPEKNGNPALIIQRSASLTSNMSQIAREIDESDQAIETTTNEPPVTAIKAGMEATRPGRRLSMQPVTGTVRRPSFQQVSTVRRSSIQTATVRKSVIPMPPQNEQTVARRASVVLKSNETEHSATTSASYHYSTADSLKPTCVQSTISEEGYQEGIPLSKLNKKASMWNIVSGSYEMIENEEMLGGGKVPFYVTVFINYLALLKLVYINVSQRSLELFDCAYNEVTQYYIFQPETSRKCFESWWFRLLPVAIGGLLLYIIGIPLMYLYLFRNRILILKIQPRERTKWQKFILQLTYRRNAQFKNSACYWDSVLMLRQLAIIGCQLFFTKFIAFQSQVVIMIFVIFLYPQMSVLPYAIPSVNRLEAMTQMSAILVLMCGIMFYIQEFKTEAEVDMLGYSVLTVIIGTSLLVIGALVSHLRYLYIEYRVKLRQKQKRKLQA